MLVRSVGWWENNCCISRAAFLIPSRISSFFLHAFPSQLIGIPMAYTPCASCSSKTSRLHTRLNFFLSYFKAEKIDRAIASMWFGSYGSSYSVHQRKLAQIEVRNSCQNGAERFVYFEPRSGESNEWLSLKFSSVFKTNGRIREEAFEKKGSAPLSPFNFGSNVRTGLGKWVKGRRERVLGKQATAQSY